MNSSSITEWLVVKVKSSAPAWLLALAVAAFHAIYRKYFINDSNMLGHDFSANVPWLMDGYLWISNNGIGPIPWVSPSFCAGQPFFADPQSTYFSLTQWVTLFLDPVQSVYLSVHVFLVAGLVGMYVFCRYVTATSITAAAVAAFAFGMNGFFAHRMVVGHMGYMPFMLVPFLAFLLSVKSPNTRIWDLWLGLLSGLVLAWMLFSGLGTLMVPAVLATLALLLIAQIRLNSVWRHATLRSVVACLVALLISLSKLTLVGDLMSNFPRSQYLLPGLGSVTDVLQVVFVSLFYPSQYVYDVSAPLWRNLQVALAPHELAFGLTPIPLFILVIAVGYLRLRNGYTLGRMWADSFGKRRWIFMLAAVLALPLFLLYYSPSWNAILKQLPVFGSTTSPMRWLIICIPALAVLFGLALECLPRRNWIAAFSVAGIGLFTALEDRSFYEAQMQYDAAPVVALYKKIDAGEARPIIKGIAGPENPIFQRNAQMNAFTQGLSPLYCYNPLFGYRLERYKAGPLHDGPVFGSEPHGPINIRNPACLVYPKENSCESLWDSFRPDQRQQAINFVSYKPFDFEMPLRQRVANAVSWVAALLSLAAALIGGIVLWMRRRSGDMG
jgi:hypothetical protein